MKKLLLFFIAFLLCGFVQAQSLAFDNTLPLDNTIAFRYPTTSDEAHTIHISLQGVASEQNFAFSVTVLSKSTAAVMRDFELNLAGLGAGVDRHNPASFTLTAKQNTSVIDRFILLDIKAASPDTVFHTMLKIVLTTSPGKVRPTDITNTPKFEFVTYTDFKGYDPEEPNGVAQSQFLFKLPINRHYTHWKDGAKHNASGFALFFPLAFFSTALIKAASHLA